MKTMEEVRKELITMVGANGKIFTVNFTKKNGDLRALNCRLGVKGVSTSVKGYPELMRVWDVVNRGYRTINLETTKRIAGGGQEISFK